MDADAVHRSRNVVSLGDFAAAARHPELRFTVSARGVRADIDVATYLKIWFMPLDLGQIESVFGSTTTPSRLYGGRPFNRSASLTDEHVDRLESLGIGLSLTLTNHFFDEDSYRQSAELLERHHRPGNSVSCVSDELARRLRRDFPRYRLKASMIKGLGSREAITESLDLYDRVTVPMDRNDDDAFLQSLPEKDRVVLFVNARCAYTCSARTCYYAFSQRNQGREVTSGCSRDVREREKPGLVYFDLDKLRDMGFRHFKVIPDVTAQDAMEALARRLCRITA